MYSHVPVAFSIQKFSYAAKPLYGASDEGLAEMTYFLGTYPFDLKCQKCRKYATSGPRSFRISVHLDSEG